jgi:cell division protease FtsH
MTVFRPQEDKDYTSRNEMFERIVTALGGRTAERLFLGDTSTGAAGDIQQASAIARAMVTKYGMSDKIGPISFDDSSRSVFIGRDFSQTKSYSEKTAATIDDEVKRLFDEAHKKCEAILKKNKKLIEALVDYLIENETMDGEDFKYFCENNGKAPPKKETPPPPQEPPEEPPAEKVEESEEPVEPEGVPEPEPAGA